MNYGMEPPPYDPNHQHPPPHGWRRVTFTGGTLDGQQRLVRISVSEGDDYNLIGTAETYSWDGTQFVLQNHDIEWPDGTEDTMSSETETETTEAPEPEPDTGEDGGEEEADGDTDAG